MELPSLEREMNLRSTPCYFIMLTTPNIPQEMFIMYSMLRCGEYRALLFSLELGDCSLDMRWPLRGAGGAEPAVALAPGYGKSHTSRPKVVSRPPLLLR